MSEIQLYQGEDRYVIIFKWNAFYRRARITSLRKIESLYTIQYIGYLNGHKIIDETIAREDSPYHSMEKENGYKTA